MDSNPSQIPPPVVGEPSPRRQGKNRDSARSILSTLAIFIIAPLIALLLTSFVFQSYEVDGPSMETTLQNRDRLIVWKIPRTWARITGNNYIPARGDVVVFLHDESAANIFGEKRQLIKRVIGLPGERVHIEDGVVTVFNSDNPEGFQPDRTLPYGSVIKTTTGVVDTIVPEGEVYVCGDNRDNSLDSRSFGTVPAQDIVGKLIFRVFPLSKADAF